MRDAKDAAAVGAGVGVLTTSSMLLAGVFLSSGRLDGGTAATLLIIVTMVPGLAFLLAGMFMAGKLLKWADAGRSRGTVLALGFLLGLPIGMGLLGVVMLLVLVFGTRNFAWVSDPDSLITLGAITAGGGAMGLACAWWMTRPPKEAA